MLCIAYPLPTDAVARVQAADPETFLHWRERVLSAATLEEVCAAWPWAGRTR